VLDPLARLGSSEYLGRQVAADSELAPHSGQMGPEDHHAGHRIGYIQKRSATGPRRLGANCGSRTTKARVASPRSTATGLAFLADSTAVNVRDEGNFEPAVQVAARASLHNVGGDRRPISAPTRRSGRHEEISIRPTISTSCRRSGKERPFTRDPRESERSAGATTCILVANAAEPRTRREYIDEHLDADVQAQCSRAALLTVPTHSKGKRECAITQASAKPGTISPRSAPSIVILRSSGGATLSPARCLPCVEPGWRVRCRPAAAQVRLLTGSVCRLRGAGGVVVVRVELARRALRLGSQ